MSTTLLMGLQFVKLVKSLLIFAINFLMKLLVVDEGEICYNIVLLSQNEKIIAEPAGAMSIAALRKYKNKIKNKKYHVFDMRRKQ